MTPGERDEFEDRLEEAMQVSATPVPTKPPGRHHLIRTFLLGVVAAVGIAMVLAVVDTTPTSARHDPAPTTAVVDP